MSIYPLLFPVLFVFLFVRVFARHPVKAHTRHCRSLTYLHRLFLLAQPSSAQPSLLSLTAQILTASFCFHPDSCYITFTLAGLSTFGQPFPCLSSSLCLQNLPCRHLFESSSATCPFWCARSSNFTCPIASLASIIPSLPPTHDCQPRPKGRFL